MRHMVESYVCDRCGKKLKTYRNSLDIRTSLREIQHHWARLHVTIVHKHGVHNSFKAERADLCKGCTIHLLEDALKRVRAGERASEGTESVEQEGWHI
jgi:protein-arginine kinase activator protein McsA